MIFCSKRVIVITTSLKCEIKGHESKFFKGRRKHMEKLRFAEFEDSVNGTHKYTCLISDAEMLSYLFFFFFNL